MNKFTRHINKTLPSFLDELNKDAESNLQKITPEGARPYYGAKDIEVPNLIDYTAAVMLTEKIIVGYEGLMKFLSYIRLTEDLKKHKKGV